ncbi:MAG: hypothetical protein RLZZ385_1978 [Pseudomonadota bacterium]|jgi:hypothetical protein
MNLPQHQRHATSRNPTFLPVLVTWLLTAVWSLSAAAAESYDGNSWYQVELSIFTNEFSGGADTERFTPQQLNLSFPNRLRRLETYFDLLSLSPPEPAPFEAAPVADAPLDPWRQWLLATGPQPRVSPLQFLLPDPDRSAFLQLPASLSDFQQTNRALERASDTRLLFHGLWRQPMFTRSQAMAVLVQGGQRYGERHELEGSLTFRFNDSRDRVVLDTNVWLTEFTTSADGQDTWHLPDIPARFAESQTTGDISYGVNRIVQIRHSRDMRSNEFHYLDHPLLGVVVSVKPYDLPPPAPRIPGSAD